MLAVTGTRCTYLTMSNTQLREISSFYYEQYYCSSGSSQYLEPPEHDLRPEQKILSSEEAMVDLRKRDRAALVRLRGKGTQTVGFLFASYFLLEKDKFTKLDIIFKKMVVPQSVSLFSF